ncbi:MAG: flavodoxin family protein [Armatimonadota bacterium]|mgnify:CR=1 FL=1
MKLKVLGISTTPRLGGNTDVLLREALKGATSAGGEAQYVSLRDVSLAPCRACGDCYRTGECVVQDAYQEILAKILAADRIVFASPVYFTSVCAQAKTLVDRCQCLWVRKYVLQQPFFPEGYRDRRGLFIAVGGQPGTRMFDCVGLVAKYWFDALEVLHEGSLFINAVDKRGEILKHPRALAEAQRLGRRLADPTSPPLKEPEVVRLFESPPETSKGAGQSVC